MFVRFDAWLLNKCQIFSDWLTKIVGLQEANYKIANLFLVLCMACFVCSSLCLTSLSVAIFSLACNGVVGFCLCRIYFLEMARDDAAPCEARKDPLRFFVFRLLIWMNLFWFIYLLIKPKLQSVEEQDYFVFHLFLSMATAFELSFAYFVCCSRLPPTTSKVAQWLMKAFMKLVPVGSRR